MCSFDNLACLVVTMWPTLEKLRCDVAVLVGMQRHLWVACAMIAYLRDAWAQCLRENILGAVHPFRVEVIYFMFYLVYFFLRQWFAFATGINVPVPHKVTLHQGMNWG